MYCAENCCIVSDGMNEKSEMNGWMIQMIQLIQLIHTTPKCYISIACKCFKSFETSFETKKFESFEKVLFEILMQKVSKQKCLKKFKKVWNKNVLKHKIVKKFETKSFETKKVWKVLIISIMIQIHSKYK